MVFNVKDNMLHTKTDYPHAIRVIENTWIPMSDGIRLAARIWLPEDAEQQPVPAILEYIPYRKNDFTALRDSIRHPYFAGHGYACIRVDMRGSGDSDGILYDEYLKQEQDDALEVLAWLEKQPWCTGAVGIIGKSWGGFNGLQIAARRPPQLKAVITLCSTDDRYADDVHYMGGCLLASDMLWWASIMLVYNARPPDPRFVGECWREMWLERLEKTPPFVEAWLPHQRRDAFWQHGSVCENYADITCPVFAVGGWVDGYTNAIPRLLEGLSSPKLGLIGPWAHEYPEVAVPGPQIGFLQECLRWWDHWLKGSDTGVMQEPLLRAWLQESVPPQVDYAVRPGRWVAEQTWPGAGIQSQVYELSVSSQQLSVSSEQSPRSTDHSSLITYHLPIPSIQTHGLYAGVWCPFGQPGDLASDQRIEDGVSTCFTSAPLPERQEILGFPEVTLTLSADKPNALVAVRLCAVAPDGASTLVSWGLLNLTHRTSHAEPTPLVSGERYTVTVRLNAIGYALPAGHRWRVALAPTYWPHAWPSPEVATLTLFAGQLSLPVRPPRPAEDEQVSFLSAEVAPLMPRETLHTETRKRTVHHDLLTGASTLTDYSDEGRRRLLPDGIEFDTIGNDTYTIIEGDPLSASVRCERSIQVGRGAWQTRVDGVSTMTADASKFYVTNTLDAYEGNTRIFAKTWTFTVLRDFV
ncbi:MAG: CocE/NonD family hydrolase [Caldilineaceae bacterium]